jgi:hypothetical protein
MNKSQYDLFLSMLSTRRNPNGILFAKGGNWFATCEQEAILFIQELIALGIVTEYHWHDVILTARIEVE